MFVNNPFSAQSQLSLNHKARSDLKLHQTSPLYHTHLIVTYRTTQKRQQQKTYTDCTMYMLISSKIEDFSLFYYNVARKTQTKVEKIMKIFKGGNSVIHIHRCNCRSFVAHIRHTYPYCMYFGFPFRFCSIK